MNDLERLLDGVTEQTTVKAAVGRLLGNIAERWRKRHPENPDFPNLLAQNTETISDHVLANTPVVSTTMVHAPPPAHPEEAAASASEEEARPLAITGPDERRRAARVQSVYSYCETADTVPAWQSFINDHERESDPATRELVENARKRKAELEAKPGFIG